MSEDKIIEKLEYMLYARKELTVVTGWTPSGRGVSLVSSFDIDGVTQEGARFRATALPAFPDRNVVLQLEFHPPTGRGGTFVRIEWRPLRAHSNRGLGPPKYRFRLIGGSQLHSFELNKALGFSMMVRDNLPIAIPLEPEPPDFVTFLNVAGKLFHIIDLDRIPFPPWQLELPQL
jgi:hypothetical protein